jgi:hypothetical protein
MQASKTPHRRGDGSERDRKISRPFTRHAAPFGLAIRFALAAGVALAMGLPFIRVGTRSRSAYAAVRSARTLELTDGTLRTAVVVAIVATPFLASMLGLLSAASGQFGRRSSAAVAFAIALIGTTVGTVGLFASGLRLAGPPVTTGAGVLLAFITMGGLIGNRPADAERQSSKDGTRTEELRDERPDP